MLFNIENTEKYKKISLLGLKINIKKKPKDTLIINRLNRIENNINMISELLLKKLHNENIMHEVNLWNEHLYFQDTIPSNTVKFVENEINNNYEYKKIMQIDFKEGDIVIDIGANVGMVSILLAKKFPFIKIYSFEPLKENYDNFIKNIELNNIPKGVITAENKAVTKDGRLITMSINSSNKGGSSTTDVISVNSIMTKENSQVESITLEEIFKNYNINKLKLLKIDCEGSEYEILYNTDTNLLKNIENLRGEFHENKNLTGEYDIDKLCEYVSKYIKNYKVTKARHCFVM